MVEARLVKDYLLVSETPAVEFMLFSSFSEKQLLQTKLFVTHNIIENSPNHQKFYKVLSNQPFFGRSDFFFLTKKAYLLQIMGKRADLCPLTRIKHDKEN